MSDRTVAVAHHESAGGSSRSSGFAAATAAMAHKRAAALHTAVHELLTRITSNTDRSNAAGRRHLPPESTVRCSTIRSSPSVGSAAR
jgi:hypothetical protein